MAFTSGFFDSRNGDRTYDANDFGAVFDGIITDGIFTTIGNSMGVRPGSGLQVIVRSGHAWFNGTWSDNSGDYPLELEPSDLILPRIDAVILEIDKRLPTRDNSLKIITGYPSTNPEKPTLVNDETGGLHQYPLAYVTVPANAAIIDPSNLEGVIGSTNCPHATAILESVSIENVWQQWEGMFDDWFDSLEHIAGSDQLVQVAMALQNLKPRVEELNTKTQSVQQAVNELKQHI